MTSRGVTGHVRLTGPAGMRVRGRDADQDSVFSMISGAVQSTLTSASAALTGVPMADANAERRARTDKVGIVGLGFASLLATLFAHHPPPRCTPTHRCLVHVSAYYHRVCWSLVQRHIFPHGPLLTRSTCLLPVPSSSFSLFLLKMCLSSFPFVFSPPPASRDL